MKQFLKLFYLAAIVACLGVVDLPAQDAGQTSAKTKKRVAIINVKAANVGEGIDPQQFSTGIFNSLGDYLKTPDVELVPIEAKLPSAVEAEVIEKKVDLLIYATASHKKGGSGFGKMFGKVAPVLGQVVPMAGVAGGVGGAIAGQVASTAIMTAASMSGNVRAKDSVQIDLVIQQVVDQPASPANLYKGVLAKTYKAKAKSDGEDIITPLIEQIAQDTIDTATGKAVNAAKNDK